MIIELKNADFSENSMSTILSGSVSKNIVGWQSSLGTELQNGDKLHFHFKITDAGNAQGNTVNFAFGVATSATDLNSYMNPKPLFSLEIQPNAEYDGEITINNLTAERIYSIFSIFNGVTAAASIHWRLDWEAIRENTGS